MHNKLGRGKGKEKIGQEGGYVAFLAQFLTKYKNVKSDYIISSSIVLKQELIAGILFNIMVKGGTVKKEGRFDNSVQKSRSEIHLNNINTYTLRTV